MISLCSHGEGDNIRPRIPISDKDFGVYITTVAPWEFSYFLTGFRGSARITSLYSASASISC